MTPITLWVTSLVQESSHPQDAAYTKHCLVQRDDHLFGEGLAVPWSALGLSVYRFFCILDPETPISLN